MKHMVWTGVVLMLSAVLLLTNCTKINTDEDVEAIVEEDGGYTDKSDLNAPKTVTSTEITDFSCYFSALAYEETDTELEYDCYWFSATLKDEAVSGSCRVSTRYGNEVEKRFEMDSSFMESLQEIVVKHDFARNNGHYVEVKGLPGEYGAELTITYASGESISAYDNQDGFLSIAAMEALEKLFLGQIQSEGKASKATKAENIEETSIGELDLTLSKEFIMEDHEGSFLTVSYPVLTLGYMEWDGQQSGAEAYEALRNALDRYNRDIRMNQEAIINYGLRLAAEQIVERGEEPRELYSYVDAYVTRNDEQVVSFYEYITQYEWWIEEQYFWAGFNYDAETGRLLTYEDVFTDVEALPAFLTKTLENTYPQFSFHDNAEELIEVAIREKTTSMGFSLSHDCVHIFIADSWLGAHFRGQHLVLSYEDYPGLVKEIYQSSAEDWLMEIQYDTDYPLKDGINMRLNWEMTPESWESVDWTVTVNEEDYTESFYGYKPECYLVSSCGNYFLYVQVPTGDVSMRMNVYEITENGVTFVEQVPLAMHENVNMNSEHMVMYIDDYVFADSFMLLPYGIYHVSEKGTPELINDSEYKLDGVTLTLQQDIQVSEVDREDGNSVMGLIEADAGTVMTPYRTDRQSYIDFMCTAGIVYRFEIEEFSQDMNLSGFGTLDELFYGAPVS